MTLRVLFRRAAASFAASLAVAALGSPALAATKGNNGSHDPSRMIECDGKVYIYSTGGGAKSSSDGLTWKDEATPPWNRSLANNQGIWAPDGLFLNGQYLLYGSMWSDAKNSALVLLTTPTLTPSAAKWTDRGVAISGPTGVTHSVIDPAPVLDADGNLYVVWGGGYPFATTANSIFLTRMDNQTGLPLTSDAGWKPPDLPGYPIEQGHKEGPYIHYHSGYYYLFYQTGSCCNGATSTYTIHVARAQSIKGPYSGDRTFYAGNGDIHGPGHMGVYSACGEERFTYHYYPDSGGSVIGENELTWSDGWPTVGAESSSALKLCGMNGSGTAGAGGATATAGAGGTATAGASSLGGAGGAIDTGTAGNSLGGTDSSSAGASNGVGGASAGATSSIAGSAGTPASNAGASNANAGNTATPPANASDDGGCSVSRAPDEKQRGLGWALLSITISALTVHHRRRATRRR